MGEGRSLITLRLARPADASAMAAMSRDLIEAGLGWRYSARRIGALIDDPDTVALVADDGRGVQGFAVMRFGDDENPHAHLLLLAVRPARRREGIGRALVDWLLASARVAGLRSVRLELRIDNREALAFYRSLGFGETRVVPAYYEGKVDAVRMLKLLRRTGSTA